MICQLPFQNRTVTGPCGSLLCPYLAGVGTYCSQLLLDDFCCMLNGPDDVQFPRPRALWGLNYTSRTYFGLFGAPDNMSAASSIFAQVNVDPKTSHSVERLNTRGLNIRTFLARSPACGPSDFPRPPNIGLFRWTP